MCNPEGLEFESLHLHRSVIAPGKTSNVIYQVRRITRLIVYPKPDGLPKKEMLNSMLDYATKKYSWEWILLMSTCLLCGHIWANAPANTCIYHTCTHAHTHMCAWKHITHYTHIPIHLQTDVYISLNSYVWEHL